MNVSDFQQNTFMFKRDITFPCQWIYFLQKAFPVFPCLTDSLLETGILWLQHPLNKPARYRKREMKRAGASSQTHTSIEDGETQRADRKQGSD